MEWKNKKITEFRMAYLSHSLSEQSPLYGGSKGFLIYKKKQIQKGDSCNTEEWSVPNHIGTHVDSPQHFFDDAKTINQYEPEFWFCNNVKVILCPLNEPRWLLPKDLENDVDFEADCILIKTGFQRHRNDEVYFLDNPGLAPELARWLREKCQNLKFIGIDFISISRYSDRERGHRAHKEFLRPSPSGFPVLPVADMDLSMITDNTRIKTLLVVPIRVEGASAAPVTVIAKILKV